MIPHHRRRYLHEHDLDRGVTIYRVEAIGLAVIVALCALLAWWGWWG